MPGLRAALVTPLTGPLARFGRESATALTLWADHAAELPAPWTGVDLEVWDAAPDPGAAVRAVAARPDILFGPYGSGPTVAAANATDRVIWNHGGATSALSRPDFPHIINVLSPASSYFDGILHARTRRRSGRLHREPAPRRDRVRTGRSLTALRASAEEMGFEIQTFSFEPGSAAEVAATLPDADVLLVVGRFEDEVEAAKSLLPGDWRAASFVGAGVEEVLAPIGNLREGLLGSAQWIASVAHETDEGPDATWFVERFRRESGTEPSYPAVQAFASRDTLRPLPPGRRGRRRGAAGGGPPARMHHALRRVPPGRGDGLQVGHEVLIVQWQDGVRRVVWPPERAESSLRYPLPGWGRLQTGPSGVGRQIRPWWHLLP